jgi:hypothetical protein
MILLTALVTMAALLLAPGEGATPDVYSGKTVEVSGALSLGGFRTPFGQARGHYWLVEEQRLLTIEQPQPAPARGALGTLHYLGTATQGTFSSFVADSAKVNLVQHCKESRNATVTAFFYSVPECRAFIDKELKITSDATWLFDLTDGLIDAKAPAPLTEAAVARALTVIGPTGALHALVFRAGGTRLYAKLFPDDGLPKLLAAFGKQVKKPADAGKVLLGTRFERGTVRPGAEATKSSLELDDVVAAQLPKLALLLREVRAKLGAEKSLTYTAPRDLDGTPALVFTRADNSFLVLTQPQNAAFNAGAKYDLVYDVDSRLVASRPSR